MDKLLDFLANNYIYFLIGAGVLFFALIGFIVDLKKRNKSEEGTAEVAPEVPIEVQVPASPVAPVPAEPVATFEVPGMPAEEYRPVPPMPQATTVEEYKPVSPVLQTTPEVVNVVPEPVAPVQMPTAPVQETVEQTPKIEIEEL